MSESALRLGIGLLGGTFDPVHTGHLSLARAALQSLPLSRVEIIPAGNPWQKTGISPGIHRLNMLRIAVECEPLLRINTMELRRTGITYTIDSLKTLRNEAGPSIPLVLILGMDQWNNLSTWKDWQALTDFAHLAVCSRADIPDSIPAQQRDWAIERTADRAAVARSSSGTIVRFDMTPHLANATYIRKLVAKQPFAEAMKCLDGWLPVGVAQYIREHRLYDCKID